MTVRDILFVPINHCDMRIIDCRDVGNDTIEDVWNNWDFGEVPIELYDKAVVYLSCTKDETLVIGITM